MDALGFRIDQPLYLALFALLPVLWVIGRRSYSGMGRGRRWWALALRSAVLALLILALAGTERVRTNDRLTVLYVLDQSLSIPEDQRRAMVDFVNASVEAHRRQDAEDRVGVLVFGRRAEVEVPPLDYFPSWNQISSEIDPLHTGLAAALGQARGLFADDTARRLVLVTDGNENLGDAVAEAKALADAGISIDVVPVALTPRPEVAVDKLTVPAVVHRDQPFELKAVFSVDGIAEGEQVPGNVRIVQSSFGREQIIAEEEVQLPPGKTVLTVDASLERSGFFTYEARFVPSDPSRDGTARNNFATAYAHVQGKGQVLVIENAENPGEHDRFVDQLRQSGLEVELVTTARPFGSLVELQRFDCVVLADVPQASAVEGGEVVAFSESQLRMLVENTENLGCGLVVLGGPNSFGAGGWANTELEKALPVDCQIKDTRVIPVGALGLVIDRSGSMNGEKIQLSKAAAMAAVRSLGRRDFATVVAFDSAPITVSPLGRVGDPERVAARIRRLSASGGTDMYPAFRQVVTSLEQAEASVKHIIVLTDGQTPDQPFDQLVRQARNANITISAVAIGSDAQIPLLTNIASAGGGRFYAVRNPRAVPRIFMKEARRVSRPLVRDLDPARLPQVVSDHEILRGVGDQFPPFSGFVMTTLKENPLVEVVMRSPEPSTMENNTLLATWNYGLGRVVAFTTDTGGRWTKSWSAWDGSDPFFSQMVRWAMRPTDASQHYTLFTSTEDGATTVVVDAIDAEDDFINRATGMAGTVVGPQGESLPLVVEQVAPGRYVGRFESTDPGTYVVAIAPGGEQQTLLRTGVSVGYAKEFRDRATNHPLLETVASLVPTGGKPGVLVSDDSPEPLDASAVRLAQRDDADPYRRDLPKATAVETIWPLLVLLASCLFVGDVAVRRLRLDLSALRAAAHRLAARLIGRRVLDEAPATLNRLRDRKAAVQAEFASSRVEYEPPTGANDSADQDSPLAEISEQAPRQKRAARAAAANAPPTAEAEETYTERLLRAKRDAIQRRDRDSTD